MSEGLNHTGFAAEWRSLGEIASAIGCSDQTLRNWAKAGQLATKPLRGVLCGQAFQAYDVAANARRRPQALRKPPGYGSGPESGDLVEAGGKLPVDPEIRRALGDGVDPFTMDRHELAARLLAAGVDQGKVRAATQLANAVQKRRADEVRAGRNVPPDDVVRMIRSYGELIVEEADAGAPRIAAALLRFMRERYGVDLATKHPNALAELDDFIRAQSQETLAAIRRRVDDQTHGVQHLDFSA